MVFQCVNRTGGNRIDREMDRMLSTIFGEVPSEFRSRRTAPVNVWEQDDAWMVELELPGVAADQLDISVVGEELTVSVDRPNAEVEGATYFRRERPRGGLTRTLRLPTAVDSDRVEAKLVHGVLTVTLPKADAVRRRKIEVTPGE